MLMREGVSIARGDVVQGTARGSAAARTVTLLGGRVTAYGVRRTAEATAGGDDLQRPHRRPGGRRPPRSATVTEPEHLRARRRRRHGRRQHAADRPARCVLTAPAGGLPAGPTSASRSPTPGVRTTPPPPTPTPTAHPHADADRHRRRPTAKAESETTAKPRKKRPRSASAAPEVPKRLTRGGFAFPVYGEATFADDFGAARAAPIGPHQGNDVFAEFGAPVVAVTDGDGVQGRHAADLRQPAVADHRRPATRSSTPTCRAFSPAAVDGRRVKAGTVLGFVGNTGDAEPTPPHVHFEIHPGGEDEDAVDPYRILLAWQGRRDVAGRRLAAGVRADTTERPGALVAVRDFIAE